MAMRYLLCFSENALTTQNGQQNKQTNKITGGGFIFFHPYLGKIPNLTSTFSPENSIIFRLGISVSGIFGVCTVSFPFLECLDS